MKWVEEGRSMRRVMAAMGSALVLFAPLQAAAQMDGGDSGEAESHLQPSKPRGPKPPEPIERKQVDKAVEKMVRAADTNHDGLVTLAEFNAEVADLENKVISERFARVDADHNQSISMAEFAAWQHAAGSYALSDRQDVAHGEGLVPEQLPLDLGTGREARVLARLIEPLNATVIVAANIDYDAGASLEELQTYEHRKFDAADINRDGWLTFDEVEMLDPRPGAGPTRPGG